MIAEADWLTKLRHTPIALWAEGNVRIVEHPWREQPYTVWVGEHVELFTANEDKAKRVAPPLLFWLRRRRMMIDLRHEGCGGWFHHGYSRGWVISGFECEKCKDAVEVPSGDEESVERFRLWSGNLRQEAKAYIATPKPQPLRRATVAEAVLLSAYREWSEETFAAGFMSPDAAVVGLFLKEMANTEVMENYEQDFLRIVADQQEGTV